jgi:prepilin-type N-terminal cleavage/methylation domain-containing protein
MVSLKNKSKGFTIVELLIVIVVIGILATLVIVTFTGIQQKARDSKRKTDLGAIQASLESYYSSNNTYPTLTDFNDTTASTGWITTNMKGFDTNSLYDPKLPTASANPLVATTTANHYVYAVTPSGCSDAAAAANPCTNYSITATLESGGTFSKQSNN